MASWRERALERAEAARRRAAGIEADFDQLRREDEAESSGFFGGFALGLVVGAILALVFAPMRGEDGVLGITLAMGDKKVPGIAAEDVGRCAFGIFKGSELIGKTVGISGEHLTAAEMAAALGDALGEEVRYNKVPLDVFRNFPFPGADLAANTWQFVEDTNAEYCARRDIGFARSLNPRLQTFAEWLATNADRIPVPAGIEKEAIR